MEDKNKNTEPLTSEEKSQLEELLQRQAQESYHGAKNLFYSTHWLTRVIIIYAIVGLFALLYLSSQMPTRSPVVVRNYAVSNMISISFNVLFVFWWYWVKQK